MIWIDELVIKLTCFFLLGYVYTLVELFFLAYTEDIPLKRNSFNIINYFPLSYGLFLPIFSFFLSVPYYPVGSPKLREFPFVFEAEHTSSKFFSFLFLLLFFSFSLTFTSYFYSSMSPMLLLYLGWFFQVFLTFLIFQLIPLYPTLMGLAILKELKIFLLKKNKIHYLPVIPIIAECSSILFIFIAVAFNYTFFHEQVLLLLDFFLRSIYSEFFYIVMLGIFCSMISLVYIKKKEYNKYLEYIKTILKDAFLKDSSQNNLS